MLSLLSPNFKLEEVSQDDMIITSIAWGFTLGFGWLTTWTAMRQTGNIWKRYGTVSIHNTYIWLIWLEIIVCYVGTALFLPPGRIASLRSIFPTVAQISEQR